jgi:hypothetical protein
MSLSERLKFWAGEAHTMYAPGAAGGFSDSARRVVLNNMQVKIATQS